MKAPILPSIMKQVREAKFADCMTEAELRSAARKFQAATVTSFSPKRKWKIHLRPRIRVTEHSLMVGTKAIRLTGLTLSQQYAKLWSFFGEWRKANRMQAKFNAQFNLTKRATFWTPGKVVK